MSAEDEVRALIEQMDGRQLRAALDQQTRVTARIEVAHAELERIASSVGRLRPGCDAAWVQGLARKTARLIRAEIARREG